MATLRMYGNFLCNHQRNVFAPFGMMCRKKRDCVGNTMWVKTVVLMRASFARTVGKQCVMTSLICAQREGGNLLQVKKLSKI